jgi:FkbM family methyltransferase
MTFFQPNLIYDVGLHRGEDTDFYLKLGFDVVAFEADPELVAECKIRFQEALACARLRLIEGAIAPPSAGKTVAFYKSTGNSAWGTIEAAWAKRNARLGYTSETIELPKVDIGEAYRSFGIPFYLKIDVEGVDRLVLDGLREFEARPRYVSIESEKVNFAGLRDEMALLRDLGYTRFKPVQQFSVAGSAIIITRLDGTQLEHVFEENASGPFGEDIPQPWLTFEETLKEYESIFRRYRRFGDNSLFDKLPRLIQRAIRKSYRIWPGGELPGWYDTHARL